MSFWTMGIVIVTLQVVKALGAAWQESKGQDRKGG